MGWGGVGVGNRLSDMESEEKEEKCAMKNGKGKGVHNNGKRRNLQILSYRRQHLFLYSALCSHSYELRVCQCAPYALTLGAQVQYVRNM